MDARDVTDQSSFTTQVTPPPQKCARSKKFAPGVESSVFSHCCYTDVRDLWQFPFKLSVFHIVREDYREIGSIRDACQDSSNLHCLTKCNTMNYDFVLSNLNLWQRLYSRLDRKQSDRFYEVTTHRLLSIKFYSVPKFSSYFLCTELEIFRGAPTSTT